MIRFYGNSMQSVFSSYLEKSVETFMRQQEMLQARPLAELTRQNLELWAKMQETLLAAFAPPRDPAREPPSQANAKANKKTDSDDADQT
jgi:polyhydroxyalkanoate synthesis regulator protein